METIFDYNVTSEELDELALDGIETKEDYMETYTLGGSYGDISRLLYLRGDRENGMKYAELCNKEPIYGFGDYLPGLE